MDYELLRLIWWAFMAVLVVGFAVMDGFDLGVAAQLPFVARTDTQRRVAINSIGPVWDGNQVWLITAGGATFAAFPLLYAAAFSGFYFAMLLVLVALILRPVGFDFRNKLSDRRWRATWDAALFVSGAVPSVVFGVAVGNLLLGVPFHFDADLRLYYEGGLIGLLNPFGLFCGVLSLAMLLMHGAAYLALKTEGQVATRARWVLVAAALTAVVMFALGGVWVAWGMDGHVITSTVDTAGPSNPTTKTVVTRAGAWLENFARHSWMLAAPAAGFAGMVLAVLLTLRGRAGAAFMASALGVAGIIVTAGLALFPFLMPSSTHPRFGLTLWDATSSRGTLLTMTVVTVFFLPIVAAYISWVYRVLRGRVTPAYVEEHSSSLY